MPPVFDPKKYDVLLGKYPYRVRNMAMDSAPALTPRFNTGMYGENDLDMLQISGNDNFLGGMFQEEFMDPTMASSVINGYVNPTNSRLYPTPASFNLADYPSEGDVLCSSLFNGVIFFAGWNWWDGAYQNSFWSISDDGDITYYPLPAELIAAPPITQLFWSRNKPQNVLLICTGWDGEPIYQFDGTDFSLWDLEGTRDTAEFLGNLGNKLYSLSDGSGVRVYDDVSNEFSSSPITILGPSTPASSTRDNFPTSFEQFNYRLWQGKPTGLYSFDGVTGAVFIEAESQVADNCKYLAIMHGWMYFNMDGYVWRHNSVTVERLRDFRDTKILGITAGLDRIWVLTTGGPGNSVIDKDGWDVNDANVWCYDGVGWFLYNNTQTGINPAQYLAFFNNDVYTHFPGVPDGAGGQFSVIEIATEWHPGAKEVATVIGSEMSINFPNISKYLESIEVDYENLFVDDSIDVYYRSRSDIGLWGDWVKSDVSISTLSTDPKRFFSAEFKLLQFKLVITKSLTSELSVESAVLHHAIKPATRKRWKVSLLCSGDDYFNPEALKDGTVETLTAKQLRDNVYSLEQKVLPSIFLTPDFCELAEDIDEVFLGDITVNGTTNTMRPSGTIYIGSEFIHYDGKTENTLTLVKRGVYGSSSLAHTVGTVINESFRVFVENITNEQFILDESEANTYEEGRMDRGIESILTVQVTEINHDFEV